MTVAIAGGTGGLGRALVEAIQARGGHEVLVLTRKVIAQVKNHAKMFGKTNVSKDTPGLAKRLGAPVATVDYTDVDSIASVLDEAKVEIVISAVNNISGDSSSEVNLIHAADKAKLTKRFIPSYFGTPYTPE